MISDQEQIRMNFEALKEQQTVLLNVVEDLVNCQSKTATEVDNALWRARCILRQFGRRPR